VDAGGFIRHVREELGRRNVEGITDEALDVLLAWDWPGNVRELLNAIEHAIVLCRSDRITVADLPETIARSARGATDGARGRAPPSPAADAPAPAAGPDAAPRPALDGEWLSLPLGEARRRATRRFERDYLHALLARTGGRVGETAELAGVTPRALYDRMKRLGLRKEDFR